MASKVAGLLTAEMKRRDLTLTAFAELLGVSKSQAHAWVHGTHEPRLSSLRSMAKRLDKDLSELLDAA